MYREIWNLPMQFVAYFSMGYRGCNIHVARYAFIVYVRRYVSSVEVKCNVVSICWSLVYWLFRVWYVKIQFSLMFFLLGVTFVIGPSTVWLRVVLWQLRWSAYCFAFVLKNSLKVLAYVLKSSLWNHMKQFFLYFFLLYKVLSLLYFFIIGIILWMHVIERI